MLKSKSHPGLRPKLLTTKARILDGAARTMQARGIRGTRVQDILEAAQISRRTFYQYFKGTDVVLLELYIDVMGELTKRVMKSLSPSSSPMSKIRAGVKAYLAYQEDGGQLLILLQAEAIRPDSALSDYRDKVLDTLVHMLDQTVRELSNLQLDPFIYWTALVGIEGLVIHVQRDGNMSEEEHNRVEEVIVTLLMNVLSPRITSSSG